MKKMLGVLAIGMFLLSMVFVSAGPVDDFVSGTNNVIEGVFKILGPILKIVVGEQDVGADSFFAKILFLAIVFAFVMVTLQGINIFGDKDWALWMVSIAVSVLAIRWFGDINIIKTAILPYSALGIALTAGIPFMLTFYIIETRIGIKPARKFSWLFFVVVFIGLWFTRYDEIKNFGFIYLITAALGVLMMVMDGTIQRQIKKIKRERSLAPGMKKHVIKLEEELKEINKRYSDEGINYKSIYSNREGLSGWKYDVNQIEERILHLSK